MTTPRPYAHTLSAAEALAELRRCAGTQFDPEVTAAFETCCRGELPMAARGFGAQA